MRTGTLPLHLKATLLGNAIPVCQTASHVKAISKGKEVAKQVVDNR